MSVDTEKNRRAGRLASGGPIREAAALLFLEKGYAGTSMDDIAAAAQVSKQTIYTHFHSKEELFGDLVLGNAQRVEDFIATLELTLAGADDVEAALRQVARMYLRLVMRPEVLRLRRLVVGEAARFPDLARTYYEQVPGRVYEALARIFRDLASSRRLGVDDPVRAAEHFAWLTLGLPLDRGMFYPPDALTSDEELDRIADAAVQVFFNAYGRRG
jgi:TetR/AcrR family transcriptional regulator, mexJK operon transcriptional repressor